MRLANQTLAFLTLLFINLLFFPRIPDLLTHALGLPYIQEQVDPGDYTQGATENELHSLPPSFSGDSFDIVHVGFTSGVH